MTHPVEINFMAMDTSDLAARTGRIAVLVPQTGKLPGGLPRPTREAAMRALASDAWAEVKPGKALELAFPAGLKAEALQLVSLPRSTDTATARAAGASIGARLGKSDLLVIAEAHPRAADVAQGLALRAYDFSAYKTKKRMPATTRPRARRAARAAPRPMPMPRRAAASISCTRIPRR